MSNVEEGDLNAQKLARTLEEYEEIVAEALGKSEEEVLEHIAKIENFHEIDRLRGALARKIEEYKIGTPERIRIGRLLSVASARHKELKPKSSKGFGHPEYRKFRKSLAKK